MFESESVHEGDSVLPETDEGDPFGPDGRWLDQRWCEPWDPALDDLPELSAEVASLLAASPPRASATRRLQLAVTGTLAPSIGPDAGADPDRWLWERADAPVTAMTVADLVAVEVSALTSAEAVAFLARHAQAVAWLESLALPALLAAAGAAPRTTTVAGVGDRRTITLEDAAREEVAAALSLAPVTAQARIDLARIVHRHLPSTAEAWTAGRLSSMHVRVLAEAVDAAAAVITVDSRPLDPESEEGRAVLGDLAHRLEARVLPRATTLTVGALRSTVTRVMRALDPAGAAERMRRARRGRDVVVRHDGDGMSTLIARLGTERAVAVSAAVAALAGDERFTPLDPTGQPPATATAAELAANGPRRAEALAALVLAGRDPLSADPDGQDARAEIALVVDLETLTGLREAPVETWTGLGVPADVALALAADARIRRIVCDPVSGDLLDVGRTTYRVPEPLARLVRARDRVCRFPGCARSAWRCDLDHQRPWGQAGTTDRANLGPLCRRHHLLKTHGGWSLATPGRAGAGPPDPRSPGDDPPGCVTWRSPQGRRYVVEPRPVREVVSTPRG